MYKEIRKDYKKRLKNDEWRIYNTKANFSMGSLESIDVTDIVTGSRFILDRNDISNACIDFIEKSIK